MVVLRPGQHLAELVDEAVAGGADALGVAGGDGSLGVVATAAQAHGLPFVCVPAGTRNHFALDLGLDRGDPVRALDAFTNGTERRIDIGQVNGRLFLNNVSLGLYGDAVQQPAYRDAKLRTLLATARARLGPSAEAPGCASSTISAATTRTPPSCWSPTTRMRGAPARARNPPGPRQRAARDHRARRAAPPPAAPRQSVERVATGGAGPAPVHAGIDGEAVELRPPLEFVIRPAALRVRVPPRGEAITQSM